MLKAENYDKLIILRIFTFCFAPECTKERERFSRLSLAPQGAKLHHGKKNKKQKTTTTKNTVIKSY
jgi:hypothetical protein